MDYIKTAAYSFLFVSLISCTSVETDNTESSAIAETLSEQDSSASAEPEMDVVEKNNALQLRAEIKEYQLIIENTKADLDKGTIDLSAARTGISQNWDKLDFYMTGDEAVRIKTYPSADNGDKTEEFYFRDNELIFALVESEGDKNASIADESAGTAFYYSNGELIVSENFKITETTGEQKTEMELGTKLQDEAIEYLELVYKSKE
jgi:hypothetical protein